jgi:Family of unknown function (DUF5657)
MPNFQITPEQIMGFLQKLQPTFFYKWVLLLLVIGFIIFYIVIFNQIRSLEKVISQPASSAILSLIAIIFIIAGIGLFLFIYTTNI